MNGKNLMPAIFGALLAISVTLGGWSLKTVLDVQTRVTKIEAKLEADQSIPQWVAERISDFESRLRDLERSP